MKNIPSDIYFSAFYSSVVWELCFRLHLILAGILLPCFYTACDGENAAHDQLEEGIRDAGVPSQNTSTTLSRLHVDGKHIKDEKGRVVILRGINCSGDSKVPPFRPISHASMLDPLPDWGINVIRLLFTWEAFEPERGANNTSYLKYYEQVVSWAAERDLYVIVDFHQDAYSRYALNGCGDGFPAWAISSEVELAEPDNGVGCENWGVMMATNPSLQTIWNYFHNDSEGAKSAYIEMVGTVAEHLSKYENVVGYELLNEPWGTAEELTGLFNAVGAAIRAGHPEAILFVPSHALASAGLPAPEPLKPSFDNIIYAPHFYDSSVLLQQTWTGVSPATALNTMAKKANDWQVPLFLGEFGAPADTVNGKGYMDALYTWLNDGFHSGAQWNYTPTWQENSKDGWNNEDLSIVDDKGELRENFNPHPHPLAIAGEPIHFVENEQEMILRWKHNRSLTTTELYVPEGFAKDKLLTTISGAQCNLKGILLSCTADRNIDLFVTIQ